MLLNVLIKSARIQESMSAPSFVFSDIEIEGTTPPSIGLRYVNRKLVDDKSEITTTGDQNLTLTK